MPQRLSGYRDRDHMAHRDRNIYRLALYGKHLPAFSLESLRSYTVPHLRAEGQYPPEAPLPQYLWLLRIALHPFPQAGGLPLDIPLSHEASHGT